MDRESGPQDCVSLLVGPDIRLVCVQGGRDWHDMRLVRMQGLWGLA